MSVPTHVAQTLDEHAAPSVLRSAEVCAACLCTHTLRTPSPTLRNTRNSVRACVVSTCGYRVKKAVRIIPMGSKQTLLDRFHDRCAVIVAQVESFSRLPTPKIPDRRNPSRIAFSITQHFVDIFDSQVESPSRSPNTLGVYRLLDYPLQTDLKQEMRNEEIRCRLRA